MTETFLKKMEEETSQLGISLSREQMEQFFLFYEALVEKNKVMNLTAITEEGEVVTKHFCDSLSLVRAYPQIAKEPLEVIDVGTGAGFPGIPLKIAFPQLKITLLDSLNKRIRFLEEVCDKLGLEQVRCIHGRAEDFGRDAAHREAYDLCVSRAVANLASLSEYCIPFVRTGGCFIPYKSGEIQEELEQGKRAVSILGGTVEDTICFTLPGGENGRSLVKIRKEKKTSGKYPRKAGTPSKEPLGIS